MAAPLVSDIRMAYRIAYGRHPTDAEVSQWQQVDSGNAAGTGFAPKMVASLSQLPEAKNTTNALALARSEGPMVVTKEDGTSTTTPSPQPAPTSSSSSTPSFSSSTPAPSYTPSAGPAPSYTPTYSTGGYQPTVDQYGNVARFVPQGMGYTPNQYATYTPSAPSAPGAPVQAFPGSSTISGVNVPAQANQGQYANIPLNNQFVGAMTVGGGTGEGGVQFPTFTFDFAKEQADAYARLKPFYEKLLSFAGGRLDLAQRILDYTYQQGMRESKQEYEQSVKEQDLTFPQEQEQMKTTQNQRGILTSGFGNTERSRLQQSQGLRREAVDRALENRESRLVSQRGFGLEEKQQGFEEEKFGQERERRQESTELSKDKFSIKQAEYQSEMDKALRAEQKAIRESDRAFQIKLAKGEF